MFEDRVALCTQLLRTHGHTHLDVLYFPLSPCATIHPHAAVFEPCRLVLFLKVESSKHSVRTLAVCAVGVGEVACHEYLLRLNLLHEVAHDIDVALAHRQFFYLTALVEGQVEEVDVVERYAVVGAGGACLAAANQSLDGAYVGGVHVAGFLCSEEHLDVGIHLLYGLVAVVDEQLVEAVDEVHEACHLLVAYGNVAGGLIGDVYVVALLHETAYGASH